MKYQCEVIVNLPRERVVKLFDNPDNLKYWQPGLKSFEFLSGSPGEPGSRAKLKYRMGKKEIEMIETITKRDLPDEFSGTYETKGVWNSVANKFIPIEKDKTKIVSDVEFKLTGFMKLMGFFMPGAFKKESQKFLDQFKAYAEGERRI